MAFFDLPPPLAAPRGRRRWRGRGWRVFRFFRRGPRRPRAARLFFGRSPVFGLVASVFFPRPRFFLFPPFRFFCRRRPPFFHFFRRFGSQGFHGFPAFTRTAGQSRRPHPKSHKNKKMGFTASKTCRVRPAPALRTRLGVPPRGPGESERGGGCYIAKSNKRNPKTLSGPLRR